MRAIYRSSSNLGQAKNITHGFFTRAGGQSEGVYASLNCGFGSGDAYESVRQNRHFVAEEMGVADESLVTPYQIHSAEAVIASKAWGREDAPKADAVITNLPGLAVGVLTADCGPILFAEPEARVVAAAHAGWKGAFGGVIENTLSKMEALGANRKDVSVAIGPTISQDSYEIGDEFYENFVSSSPENARFFKQYGSGKYHFDLPGYISERLRLAGVSNIENMELCTLKSESLFYSYRRSTLNREPDYGRQISAIRLK